MKKLLYVLLTIMCGIVFVGNTNARTNATNLKEAVEEEIEVYDGKTIYEDYVSQLKSADFSNYSESPEKVNVYIFRGDYCSYCLREIAWFTTELKENGKYFNIITYETWNNTNNRKLMQTVAAYLNENVSSVPFTIIGDKTWSGFGNSTGSEMISTIKTMYNQQNRYDIKDYIDLDNNIVLKEDNLKSSSNSNVISSISSSSKNSYDSKSSSKEVNESSSSLESKKIISDENTKKIVIIVVIISLIVIVILLIILLMLKKNFEQKNKGE